MPQHSGKATDRVLVVGADARVAVLPAHSCATDMCNRQALDFRGGKFCRSTDPLRDRRHSMVTWVDTMGTMQRGKQAIACAPEGQRLPFWGARGQVPSFPACVLLGVS